MINMSRFKYDICCIYAKLKLCDGQTTKLTASVANHDLYTGMSELLIMLVVKTR